MTESPVGSGLQSSMIRMVSSQWPNCHALLGCSKGHRISIEFQSWGMSCRWMDGWMDE